jgi:hypothetical protein
MTEPYTPGGRCQSPPSATAFRGSAGLETLVVALAGDIHGKNDAPRFSLPVSTARQVSQW